MEIIMALPKIQTTTYKVKLPSTGKSIEYRPFLVKEEKMLMMLGETKDQQELARNVKNLLSNCIITDIDVDNLTTFDIEYLFLALRAKSVGEVVSLFIPCEKCEKKNPIDINLEKDVYVDMKKKQDFKIPITSDVGLIMKYPSMDMVGFDEEKSDSIDMIISCLESIYDSSTVHNVSDYTNEEVRDFIQSLSVRDIQKIQTFFENIPKVKCKSNFLCPHCKAQNDTDIEGLSNFF